MTASPQILRGEKVAQQPTYDALAWIAIDVVLYTYGAIFLFFAGLVTIFLGVADALRGNPNQMGWPVAAAGGLVTLIVAVAVICFWPWSRRFVQRFEFDGRMLSYALGPQQELQSRPVTDLAKVWKHRCDYRLEFLDGERLVVTFDVPRAIELYKALQAAVGPGAAHPARLP